MVTPSVRAFKTHFPGSELHFLTEPPADEILGANPYIDRIILHRPGQTRMRDLLRELRREKYDLVIDFFGNPRSAWLGYLSGARRRIGFDYRFRGWLYTDHLPAREYRRVYSAGLKLQLLEFLGIKSADCSIEVFLTDEETKRARDRVCDLFAGRAEEGFWTLSPVSRRPYKRWPKEKWASVCRELARRGENVLLVYGPGEKQVAGQVWESSRKSAVLWEEGCSVRDLAAVMSFSKGYIGNDNMHKHLARALGLPTFTVFGPVGAQSWTDPVFPLQYYIERPWMCKKSCRDGKKCGWACITELPEDEVIERVNLFISEVEKERETIVSG